MSATAKRQVVLQRLLDQGSLAESACSRAFVRFVSPLIGGSVLAWEKSGAGRRLAVRNPGRLAEFHSRHFPKTENQVENLPPRAQGVARFRNTKATTNSENEIVSVRVWRDDSLWHDGKPVSAATATVTYGVFSFLLSRKCSCELRGLCALVENPAVFTTFEQLNLDVGAVVYGHGRISNRMVDWLAKATDSNFRLIHLPDYDPVGLSEYQRLHSRLGDRVVLHLPADLEMRFRQFSNPELLEKGNSQAILAQMRRSALPAIQRVIQLIDGHNAGLEQEALLLPI